MLYRVGEFELVRLLVIRSIISQQSRLPAGLSLSRAHRHHHTPSHPDFNDDY